MREISFRGKRTDNGEWVEGFFILAENVCKPNNDITPFIFETDATYYGFGEFCGVSEIVPETIGQFTGLTDKNDKKIFEGDILKCSDSTFCVVEWDEQNARFLGFTIGAERFIAYVGREPKSEIIGNIHDNPELLEVSSWAAKQNRALCGK